MTPESGGFCPECGAKVRGDQKFCRRCGTDLTPSVEVEPAPQAQAPFASSPAVASPPPTEELPASPAPSSTAPMSPAGASPAAVTASPQIEAVSTVAWSAWVAAGACGLLAIATGIRWFGGGFDADGFDVPLASLVSDGATGGLTLGWVFVIAAAVGLALAAVKPEPRSLTIGFLAVGSISSVIVLWYMFRVLTSLEGVPVFDALGIGFWLAFVAALAVAGMGLLLLDESRRAKG